MADGQDIFDQVAAQPQTPPPTPPPQQPAQAPAGGDVFDQVATQSDPQQNSLADAHKSWWQTVKSKLDEPVLPKVPIGPGMTTVGQAASGVDSIMNSIVQHEIAQAHPWRARLASFYKGSMDDAARFVSGLTTPTNLALFAAGGIQARVAKLALAAGNLYFAYRGGQELFSERQANETTADYVQRKLFGAAGVTAGSSGAAGNVADIGQITKQVNLQKLGLSGNLAAKVQAKVDQVDAIRSRAANDIQSTQAAATTAAQTVQQQAPVRMGQIVKDAAHAVYAENARVSQPFEEMAEAMSKPVTDAPTVRATILDTIKSHGVQDQEIPAKIFNALAKRGTEQPTVSVMGQEIGPGNPLFEKLQSQGALGEVSRPVSFKDLTRVRGDLWDAAQSASDGTVKAAMFDAYDGMTQMQEDFAQKNGFGDKYRAAKEDYKVFKRELGSGLMSDFLRAEDFKQQAMAPRIAKLMTSQDAEALRGLLKIAGVDTSPLDQLTGGKSVKGAVGEIEKGAATAAKVIQTGAEKQIRTLGKQQPIIPGRSDLELAGKSTEEIRAEAIQKLASNMQRQGMSNPMGFLMTIYGAIRMASGSPFGVYQFSRGTSTLSRNLLKNPSFQDWVIHDSGVDPSNLTLIQKLRRAMDRSGALARTSVQMGRNAQNETRVGP